MKASEAFANCPELPKEKNQSVSDKLNLTIGQHVGYDTDLCFNSLTDEILKVVLESLPKIKEVDYGSYGWAANWGWNECLREIAKRLKGE